MATSLLKLRSFASLWKSESFDVEGRFDRNMTLKFVFVGGHKSGKTSVINVLMKKGFSKDYIPTIGVDMYKMRLRGFSEMGEAMSPFMEQTWLQIWDVSHAELSGAHESFIFHEAHAIVVVCDLTSFASIQAVDDWLKAVSVYLTHLTQSQVDSKSKIPKSDLNTSTNAANVKGVLLPRVYLLINKYDLSELRVLSDSEVHRFCKSCCVRAWGRVSALVDRRSELVQMMKHFATDVLKHLPKHAVARHELGPVEGDESEFTRYARAIQKLARTKIHHSALGSVFDAHESARTFEWAATPTAAPLKGAETLDDEQSDASGDYDSDDEKSTATIKLSGPSADKQLTEVVKKAREVLKAMNESIKLQRLKATKTVRRSGTVASGVRGVAVLKLEMLRVLESELASLTRVWEDELNTVSELIHFKTPLIQVRRDLDQLSQEIVARQILFKNRLRRIHNLRTT